MSSVLKFAVVMLVFGFFMEARPVSYVVQGLHGSWVSTAQALVGRPATPVSVAGAARRTVRRY